MGQTAAQKAAQKAAQVAIFQLLADRQCLTPDVQQKQSIDCKTGSLRKMMKLMKLFQENVFGMLGLILVSLMINSQIRSPEKLQDVAKFPKELVKGVGLSGGLLLACS